MTEITYQGKETYLPNDIILKTLYRERLKLMKSWLTIPGFTLLTPIEAVSDLCGYLTQYLSNAAHTLPHIETFELVSTDSVCDGPAHSILGVFDKGNKLYFAVDGSPQQTFRYADVPLESMVVTPLCLSQNELIKITGKLFLTKDNKHSTWTREPLSMYEPVSALTKRIRRQVVINVGKKIAVV